MYRSRRTQGHRLVLACTSKSVSDNPALLGLRLGARSQDHRMRFLRWLEIVTDAIGLHREGSDQE